MKMHVLAAVLLAELVAPLPAVAAADPLPCESMLKDLRAALTSAKPNASDKTKVDALEAKGLERCKADDDAGADALFAEALKLLGK